MSKILKNQSITNDFMITDIGINIPKNSQYVIDASNYNVFSGSSDLISAISTGDLVYNDGASDLDVAAAVRHLQGSYPSKIGITDSPPFAAKQLPNGKKLFSRVHGIKYTVSAGSNILDYSVPYAQIKFNELEIIGAEIGDRAILKILDDASGTYTTVPNYQLNQFGFSVAVAKDFYDRVSNYDADLYYGMRIYIEFESVSAKDIYINYIMHELKD